MLPRAMEGTPCLTEILESHNISYIDLPVYRTVYETPVPCSLENVNKAKADFFDTVKLSNTVKRILSLGTEITSLLAAFIENGKESGAVRQDVVPMMTVYIWWSSITSLLSLVQTKGKFIAKQFSVSETDFLEYGFQQLINSILEVKI